METKLQKIVYCMDRWMWLREQGITITDYCKEHKAESISVYGYGRLGKHLVWELQNEVFQIPWIMDQRSMDIDVDHNKYELILPHEVNRVKDADMIIVTAVEDYYDIEAELSKYTKAEIISIERIIKFLIEE